MVLLDKIWDDVFAGPQPERGLGKLRKAVSAKPLTIKELGAESSGTSKTESTPATPATPSTPATSTTPRKPDVWRSVFHPGSNVATKTLGANLFDKPQHPNSPSVYDWMYSSESRSIHR